MSNSYVPCTYVCSICSIFIFIFVVLEETTPVLDTKQYSTLWSTKVSTASMHTNIVNGRGEDVAGILCTVT